MTEQEIATLFAATGLYVLEDGRIPGCTTAVMTVKDSHHGEEVRRVFQLITGCELTPDPQMWKKNATTKLVGGPFSVQACKLLEEQGQELHDLQAAVAEAKHLLTMYRDTMLKNDLQHEAFAMQDVIDTLTPEKEKK